jgi:hypothetical protein
MYTSCGWFFDEISGIETVQIIAYAGRVLQLAEQLFGEPGKALEAEFLAVLAQAPSNLPEIGNGAEVYKRYVLGSRLDLEHVGAHYAISSMFRSYPDSGQIFCFDVHRHSYDVLSSGHGRFAFGRALLMQSRITEESEDICFAVLHLGDQNLTAAVKRYQQQQSEKNDAPKYGSSSSEAARDCVRRANLPELIRLIDRHFDGTLYSLNSSSPMSSTASCKASSTRRSRRSRRFSDAHLRRARDAARLHQPGKAFHRAARARRHRRIRHQRKPAPRTRRRNLRCHRDLAVCCVARRSTTSSLILLCSASPQTSALSVRW